MNVYELISVGGDNPLFEGLSLKNDKDDRLLETWPTDWRINYKTWVPKSLKLSWPAPAVVGNVRRFNDFPCLEMTSPAFSRRAVDMLRDLLEPNGELLPLRHKIGTYFFFNCTRMTNCIDLTESKTMKLDDGGVVSSTEKLVFIDKMLDDLTIFKIRTQLIEIFCIQSFVDRVEAAGLQGFLFIPIWPLPNGVTFYDEMYRLSKAAHKWKPKDMEELDIKGNTVVLRLYCEHKKANKKELNAAEKVMTHLEKSLYDENQAHSESYFGNIEGHDAVDYEIRVFLSAPDSDRLVRHLMPSFRTLPWPGTFHVVKRRGEYVDTDAKEEYARLD
jgi:hypothetical protein